LRLCASWKSCWLVRPCCHIENEHEQPNDNQNHKVTREVHRGLLSTLSAALTHDPRAGAILPQFCEVSRA
jgi:hypothetical protein